MRIKKLGHHVEYPYPELDVPYAKTMKAHLLQGGDVPDEAFKWYPELSHAKLEYKSPIRPYKSLAPIPTKPKPVAPRISGASKVGAGAGLVGLGMMGGDAPKSYEFPPELLERIRKLQEN
jgi:hypothetical protein